MFRAFAIVLCVFVLAALPTRSVILVPAVGAHSSLFNEPEKIFHRHIPHMPRAQQTTTNGGRIRVCVQSWRALLHAPITFPFVLAMFSK